MVKLWPVALIEDSFEVLQIYKLLSTNNLLQVHNKKKKKKDKILRSRQFQVWLKYIVQEKSEVLLSYHHIFLRIFSVFSVM